MKNEPTVMRQGDVLLIRIEEFPPGVQEKLKPVTHLVLAEGEVTNHFHVVHDPEISRRKNGFDSATIRDAIACEHGEDIFFLLETPKVLTHDEHDTINLAPGKWRKVHQKEYIGDVFTRVAD